MSEQSIDHRVRQLVEDASTAITRQDLTGVIGRCTALEAEEGIADSDRRALAIAVHQAHERLRNA